jgi:hypothetical protein
LLRDSKDRLQIALNVAQLGSYRYDPRRRVFSGDMRCQEIFDFPKSGAGIEEIMELVHAARAEPGSDRDRRLKVEIVYQSIKFAVAVMAVMPSRL